MTTNFFFWINNKENLPHLRKTHKMQKVVHIPILKRLEVVVRSTIRYGHGKRVSPQTFVKMVSKRDEKGKCKKDTS